MSIIYSKHKIIFYIIFFSFFLNKCQLNEPKKSHGINFLENREKVLVLAKTNKNDVIKLIGNPHLTSIKGENSWIYFERTISRGKLIRLGQNVLKKNNILELKFDKYGVLRSKKLYKKEDMKKVTYTSKKTQNNIKQKTSLEKFLASIKQKMYGKRQF